MSDNGNQEHAGFVPAAIAHQGELAAASVATQARAMVEARYVMALQRPRDMMVVRQKLLKECERPRFAETARYSKPIGGGSVEGPSIRFAEAAVRSMGNIDVQTPTIFEDDAKRIVRVLVTDLESNSTYQTDVVVEKTVERKSAPDRSVLGRRVNSYGKEVFIVRATDDELLNKTNALISKAIRNAALRLLPGDLVDEAMEKCGRSLQERDKAEPGEATKRIVDAFDSIGVPVAELMGFVGHALTACSPAELQALRAVYTAIRDGETTWADALAARQVERTQDRDAVKVSDKDRAAIATAADKRAQALGDESIPGRAILGDLGLLDGEGSIREIAKADLPKVMKSIAGWEPGKSAKAESQGQLA